MEVLYWSRPAAGYRHRVPTRDRSHMTVEYIRHGLMERALDDLRGLPAALEG
jgi:hypothetical protein